MPQSFLRCVKSRRWWVLFPLVLGLVAPLAFAASPAPSEWTTPGADSLAYALEAYPYRVAPGDVLFVDYGIELNLRAITAEVKVRPDGRVTLPYVGEVMVAGQSTAEIEAELAKRYASVYVNPRITVAVREVAGNLVHVLGEVGRPGSYPLTPNATALQAVAAAGGFLREASRGDVVVLRRTGPNSVAVRKVNLKDLIAHKKATSDIVLQRFDIVYVNRSLVGNLKVFAENVIQPLASMGDLYIKGWQVVNIRDIFPAETQTGLKP